jgi:hypothetical protein
MTEAGRPSHRPQADAPFRFMVRPFPTVGTSSLHLANWYEDIVFATIQQTNLTSPISGVVIFPKIFDPKIADPPNDHLTYKKRERAVFVGLNINHAAWERASSSEQLDLLGNNLKRSIQRIPEAYLSRSDAETLQLIIDGAASVLAVRLLH